MHVLGAVHNFRGPHGDVQIGRVQSDAPHPSLQEHFSGPEQIPPFSQVILHTADIFRITWLSVSAIYKNSASVRLELKNAAIPEGPLNRVFSGGSPSSYPHGPRSKGAFGAPASVCAITECSGRAYGAIVNVRVAFEVDEEVILLTVEPSKGMLLPIIDNRPARAP